MINYQILIDGVDYTDKCALPFKEQYVLDSALDNAVLTLPMISKNTIFKPFTLVTIRKNNDGYNMYVASDKMTEIVGTNLYTHELVLIEETKLLEKKVVDTNTTTQPLLHDYSGIGGTYIHETSTHNTNTEDTYYESQDYPLVHKIEDGSLNIHSIYSMIGFLQSLPNEYSKSGSLLIKDINGNTVYSTSDLNATTTLNSVGSYSFTYEGMATWITTVSTDIWYKKLEFNVVIISEPSLIKKSITDVVNRLLTITETLRANETPALVFNQEQADFYGQRDTETNEPIYPAPEFSMTKSTLRECLDQVGSYIHSIVRLVGNTIYFDKLGGTTETTLDVDYIGNYETLDSEQYASQLDSIVSNLTNIDDPDTGTITEPFFGGYKTVRAESGTIRIGDGQNDTSAIIVTDYPIEKIAKLECGFITVNGTTYNVGDITPYVYEKSEYDLLDSYGGIFPYSKGYAITYTQGQNNITGLTFKLPNAVSSIFSNQAILNIISQRIGQNVQSLFNVQDITELQFRLTYYPSTTARVKQARTDFENYSMDLTSIYNQSANKVDSRAYGENLKGTIARLGNIEKFITFTTKNISNIPEVGNFITINNDDYYIATLSVENQFDYTKYTLGLSKDFNALSKYIGIKNNIRMYEVSEKQSVERYVVYDDYCIIGKLPQNIVNDSLLTKYAKIYYTYEFKGKPSNITNSTIISVARVKGNNNDSIEMDLPVISLGLGNSIWLGFKYLDNYSAGKKSVAGVSDSSSTDAQKDSNKNYRLNQDVAYADYFGEMESISVKMLSELQQVNDKSTAISVGNNLPVASLPVASLLNENIILDSNDNNIVIKKDNREQINFAYQLHFVTNDNIIIGSQLAQGSPLIGNNYSSAKLYILPNKINKFANKIDLINASLVVNYSQNTIQVYYDNTLGIIIFKDQTANANGKSWVVVDENNNLLFGKNIDIEENDEIDMPNMTFTHKIRGGE